MANELERENRELPQANEILRKASGYFAVAARPPVSQMMDFIEESREALGVEPVCRALQFAPSTCYDRRAIARDPERASRRASSMPP